MKHIELGKIIAFATVRRAGSTDYPVLSMTMREGLVNQADKFKKRIASADTSPYKVVERNQLVVGFPIDEGVLAFQNLYDEAIVSPAYNIWNLQDDASVDSRYLERFLRSPSALAFYKSKLRSTTARRRSLPSDIFLSLSVPVPPLAEQRRIMKLLDDADQLRMLSAQADRRTAALLPALFHEMFGDQAASRNSWPVKQLWEISGIIVPTRDKPKRFVGTVPWVTLPDINGLFIGTSKNQLTLEDAREVANRLMPAGTVLLSCAGTLGKVAVAAVALYANQQFYGLMPNPALLDSTFLAVSLRMKGAEFFARLAGTSTLGFFSKQRALEIDIPLPPLTLQKEFATRAAELRAMEVEQAASRRGLDGLFQSMLHQAFNGEL